MRNSLVWAVYTLYTALFLLGCTGSNSTNTLAKPDGPLRFELLPTEKTGVSFINTLQEDNEFNYMNFNYLYLSGAVGVGDFNQDGLEDIYFVASRGPNKLYLNKGNFQFEDITAKAGVAANFGAKTGVNIVDINNDGYPDIYLCRTALSPEKRGNLLYINNKDNTFSERSAEYGLNTPCASNFATFFDYDLDGDLDMYLLNHPIEFETVTKVRLQQDGAKIKRLVEPDPGDIYSSDRLYRNDKGKFTDVSKSAGIQKRAFGLSITIVDVNHDRYPDIYVSNDYIEPDNLYINNRNGTFTDQIETYTRHISHFSMGSEAVDLNNDLMEDLVVLDMAPDGNERQKLEATPMVNERYYSLVNYGYGNQIMHNMLQINNGNGTFSETACLAGIANTEWSWTPLAVDFDNNGFRDLYITNGIRKEVTNLDYMNFTLDSVIKAGGDVKDVLAFINKIPAAQIHNYMFRNMGNLQFEDMSNAWGFAEKTFSNGAAYADFDNDGDMDIVVNNASEESFIYQNKSEEFKENTHYLQIKLQGPAQNLGGIGAVVKVKAKQNNQIFTANPARGFISTSTSVLHFGLGHSDVVDQVHVQWPDGKVQILTQVPADQRLVLKYQDAAKGPSVYDELAINGAIFEDITRKTGIQAKHVEDNFFDFNRERLLPRKYSNVGPSLATGDINGDGLEDVYLGGAFKAKGTLMIQDKNGRFKSMSSAAFNADTLHEDVGALFFDADADKDLDLYVVSGGNEYPANSANYQDRLYINDGKGGFTKAPIGVLPQETESGSCVSGYDYDHDGDIDLFIGGRVVPGFFPKTPFSIILKNEGGRFSLVTDQVAPEFGKIGMVTDILFADLDGDKQEEMLVCGDWMNLEVFKQNNGKFARASAQFGLYKTSGWWESLAAADLDGDGDLDLVAGNAGLNTRYRASAQAPIQMFAKDFDGNGSIDPIMTWCENGKNYPIAQRDQIIKQIPNLKKKFVRYGAYAKATIEDVFSEADLKNAQHLQVTELKTCFFINDNGKMTMHAFPLQAQTAPTKDILLLDVDGNGALDILMAGNDYGMEVETGPYDAGNGVLLLNDGKGNFSYLPNRNSGFWASMDVRHLASIRLAQGKTGILVANNNNLLQLFGLITGKPIL